MKIALAALGAVMLAAPAYAQYYGAPPPPPPGYAPGYAPPPRGYDAPPPPPPPPGYAPPGYAEPGPYVRIGRRCLVQLESPYGPRRFECRIVDPKPVGEACACPSPPYVRSGPYVGGVTIR